MLRIIISASMALALFLVERSFFGTLPDPFPRTPLALACGVYLLQHLDLRDGAAWIVVAGALGDVIGLTPVPTGTVAAMAAAACCLALSRSVFTNRSLYGILACGACTVAVQSSVQAVVLALIGAARHAPSGWTGPLRGLPAALLMTAIILTILFRLAKGIRQGLSNTVMLNR